MRWRRRIALLLLVALLENLFPSMPSSASVQAPAAIQAAPSATPTPSPSPMPTPRPIVPQISPFRMVPRTLMPPPFAADALSAVDRLFGPQRYGASFGDPVDVESGAYTITTTDLSVHARGLNFAFTRTYNSSDDWYEPEGSSYLGGGWRHAYWWEIYLAPQGGSGCGQMLIRGDGKRERIVADGTNADFAACTFVGGQTTVTMRDQSRYVFGNRFDYEPGEYTVYSLYTLVRIELPTGDRVLLTYAGSPLGPGYEPVLSTVTDTVGRVYHFTYDALGHLVRVDDPSGRVATFGYDSSGRLIAATDPAGATTHYAYDGTSRHITTNTDPDGRVRATNSYFYTGEVTQQVDGEGNVTTRSDPSTGGVDITDPRGTLTNYTFCACGVLTRERVWPAGYGTSPNYDTLYGYDAYGNQSQLTDRLGHATSLTYEARANANLLSRTDSSGGVTSFQYDSRNNPTSLTDPRGFITQRTYDPATNVLLTDRRQVDVSSYATTSYAYGDPSNPGLPTTITSPRGSITTFAYDASGDLVTKIDPEGDVTTYTYDALGRQTSATDADGHTTTTTYDNADRVTSVTDPLGHIIRYTYDGAGDTVSVSDRNANVTTYVYDRNARLVTTTQRPNPSTVYSTSLTLDGNGNVVRVTEASGTARDAAYDSFDRVISTTESTSQGSLLTTSTRDAMGNVLSRTTPDGAITNYTYDSVYHVTTVSAPGVAISYGYDATGNRTSMTDATGTTVYLYDGAGRMTSAAAPNGTVTYSYDLDANRTSIGYPGAGTVTYGYTAAGRLSTVSDWASHVTRYSYRPTGLVASVTYPNGMVATHTYDAAGRLTQLTNAVGATTITSHAYTLDAEGNRTAVTEYVSGITAAGSTDAIAYSYDGLNRLTGSSGAVAEGFSLDGASNVTSRTGPGATYTYDGADRVQSDGTLIFNWSKADQLTFHGQATPPPPPPPAVAFRTQSTANNGFGATSLDISRPAGTQSGDTLLAFVYSQGVAAIAPSGWTSVGGPANSSGRIGQVFSHIAATSDPSSWSWTYGQYWDPEDHAWYPNSSGAVGSILAYSGVDPTAPLSPTTASTNTGSTATIATNAITTGYANEMLVASYGQYATTTAATPSEWTTRVGTVTWYSSGAMKVEDQPFASSGYTNGLQWNSGNTQPWIALMVGLKPAPPPPPPPPPAGDYFTYDPLDRLTASTVSNVARTYAYNGDGLLQSRTQSNTTTSFLWDPGSSPSQLLQLGSDRLVYGLGPLYAVKTDGSTTVFARDGGQSTRAEVSGTGTVTTSFRYRAYGAVAQFSGPGSPSYLGYTGQLLDSSGLLYMRARWYDPSTGRFLTADPLAGDAVVPATLNSFGYADSNPMMRTDPSGLRVDLGPAGSEPVIQTPGVAGECPPDCSGDGGPSGGTGGASSGGSNGGNGGGSSSVSVSPPTQPTIGAPPQATITQLRAQGIAAQDEFAASLERSGLTVRQNRFFSTSDGGLGRGRFIDVVAETPAGKFLYFEVKLGGSRYTAAQMAKDAWLSKTFGIAVKVVRLPR